MIIQNTTPEAEKLLENERRGMAAARLMTDAEQKFFLRCRNSCKKCRGDGVDGFKIVEGLKKPVPCDCIPKAMKRIIANRTKPFDGLEFGRTYSIGKYVGVKESLMNGMCHAFETSILLSSEKENSDIYVPVTDKDRVKDLREEKKMEIVGVAA